MFRVLTEKKKAFIFYVLLIILTLKTRYLKLGLYAYNKTLKNSVSNNYIFFD